MIKRKVHQAMLIRKNGLRYRAYCGQKEIDEDNLAITLDEVNCKKCLNKLKKEDGK